MPADDNGLRVSPARVYNGPMDTEQFPGVLPLSSLQALATEMKKRLAGG